MPLSDYVRSLSDEEKARYFKKLHQLGFLHEDDDPYLLEKWKSEGHFGKWSTSVQSWPEVEFGNIYVYLIDFPGYSPQSLKMYKSLDAYEYYVKGLVNEVYIQHSENGHCVIRGSVHRSQDVADEPWKAWVGFKSEDAHIVAAHCTCMTGLTPVCSHVVAIMFQVEAARHVSLKEDAGTSQHVSLPNEQMFRVLLQDVASRAIFDMIKREEPSPRVETERCNSQEDTLKTSSSGQSEVDQSYEQEKFEGGDSVDMDLQTEESSRKTRLTKPVKNHHDPGVARSLKGLPSCYKCNLTFTTNFFFESHMKRHHNEEYWKFMDEKKKSAKRETVGQRSKSDQGPVLMGKLFKCEECGNSYLKQRSLLRHMRIHTGERPFKCDECSKAFSERHSLHNHKRTHTGEKPFKCTECSRVYRNGSSLYAHMRMHRGERPYKCNECGKNFRTTTDINAHMRTHTGEKPFKCDECGKGFTQRAHLNTHIRIHTGEKPFTCNECGQSFNRTGHLQRHMIKHTGKRQFLCSLCGKGFSNGVVLRRHMEIHTRDKPVVCMECGNSFRDSGDLGKHMRCHTEEKPLC